MSFLCSETLKSRGSDLVDSFKSERVKHGAYELSLGNEVFITGEKTKRKYADGDQICVPPGQFALLITKESVKIPNDLIALISIKFSIKKPGLVNVSGFHVDPGFTGKLKFSVYNAGGHNVQITVGDPLFLIWFITLNRQTLDARKPEDEKWNKITDQDTRELQGKVASPEALQRQINNITKWTKVFVILGIPLIIFFLGRFIWQQYSKDEGLSEGRKENNQVIVLPFTNVFTLPTDSSVADSIIFYLKPLDTNTGKRIAIKIERNMWTERELGGKADTGK